MSEVLAGYELQYEDVPFIKPYRVGRAFKMSNKANTVEAPAKAYNKTRGEHIKDIIIAILVAGIIAFVGGMTFAKNNQAEIDRAVSAVQPTAQAQEPVKK